MAAAATMFAACSQNEVLNEVQVQDEAQAIGFSTYSGKTTRAENNKDAVNTTNLEAHHETFKVWGYKNTHTDYVFGGGQVKAYGAGNWTYDPKKYWDKGAKTYEFYAAAPDNGLWNLSSNTTAQNDDYFYITSFELQGTSLAHPTHQYSFESVTDCDLMIASPCSMDRSKYATSSPASKVELKFNHILSRLNVTVNKGANIKDETLNITSFKVYKLKNAGSFDENADLEGATLANGTTKRWTPTTSEYEIEGNQFSNVAVNNAGNQYIFQSLVIPQVAVSQSIDRDGSSVETAPYFTIEYTIGGEPFSATYNLAAAFAKEGLALCEGYENTLHLTIDAETIVFDASVYEWTGKYVEPFEID